MVWACDIFLKAYSKSIYLISSLYVIQEMHMTLFIHLLHDVDSCEHLSCQPDLIFQTLYIFVVGHLDGLVGSVLDHRSLPSEFESRCGPI